MRNRILIWLIGLVALPLLYNEVNAYSRGVHRRLTERTIDLNVQTLNNYLKNIGLPKGVTESVNDKFVRKWIEDGSVTEDDFWSPLVSARYLNHFYNPLTGKGLIDPPFLGTSSYKWASDDGHNEWTWKWARSYFYDGLTKTTKTQRNESLAKAFRALGQVTHLVQDLAVPAHVRNDAHSSGDPYEIYTSSKVNNLNYSLTSFPYWNLSISPYAPKQFWDLESYNGNVPYGSGYIGLSEYANANFASLDTIFSEILFSVDPHYFPFPKKSSAVLYEESDSQSAKKTKYFKIDRDSEPIKYFAVAGRFYDLYSALPYWQRLFVSFDDKCHNNYASLLIPRAVGYSAGLLNYFFRGEIDMVPDEVTGTGYVIVNNSEEDMSGTFELWYDDNYGNRKPAWSGLRNISKKSAGNNKSTNITFDPPTDAKEAGGYMLVFRGNLGNEEDAVAGKAISLIPPLVFLIYQDARNKPVYAVWSIENDGKTLKDYNFDIPKHVTLISPAERNFPSTVKSNSELNKHTAMVKNFLSQRVFERYGIYKQDEDNHVYLSGLRNSYINGVFDNSFTYTGYNVNLNNPPAYVCSGRNNWYKENKDIISDLELWKIGTNIFQTKYKVNGVATNGITTDSAKTAILSKTKFIGYDDALPPYTSYGINCSEEALNSVCSGYCSCGFVFCSGTNISYSGGSSYKFGEVELERSGSMNRETHIAPSPVTVYCGTQRVERIRYVKGGSVDIESYSLNNISLLDYDNIMDENLNPDKTFIIFYATAGNQHSRTIFDLTRSLLMHESCSASGRDFYGQRTKYILAYRIKGAGLNKIEICSLGAGTTSTGINLFVLSGDTCDCVSDKCQTISDTWVTETSGERINDVSSRVSGNYLVYSYILEDYTGPDEPLWTFKKRILGIIDVATDTRTEHEVNDTLLGQYKDKFDKTLYSAIGFHNGSLKK